MSNNTLLTQDNDIKRETIIKKERLKVISLHNEIKKSEENIFRASRSFDYFDEDEENESLKVWKGGFDMSDNKITEMIKSDVSKSPQTLVKELVIFNNVPGNKEIRRSTQFQMGINFIVDEAIDGEKANNTGKTTALKIIDVCLGAQEKKYIYTDSETDSLIQNVFDEIIENNISAKLVITDTLNVNTGEEKAVNEYELVVELKPRGNRYINGVKFSQKEYLRYLNEVVFDNSEDKPSFRQLISKFVRIGLKEDVSSSFLKFLGNYTSNNDYKWIYDYLFGLSKNEEKTVQIMKNQNALKEEKNYLKQIKKRHNNISTLSQQIASLQDYIKPKSETLNILVNGEKFKEKITRLNKKRSEFREIENDISNLKYEIDKINEYILLLDNNKQVVNKKVLENLYSEVDELIEVEKSFQDLVNFNEQLNDNQKSFQNRRKSLFEKEIERLNKSKDSMENAYDADLGLVDDAALDDYNMLFEEVTDVNKQITMLEKEMTEFSKTEKKIEEIKSLLSELEKNNRIDDKEIEERRRDFNLFFMKNSKEICGESYNILFYDEGFPIGIAPIKEGLGSGRAKSLVIAFDLSYLEYAIEYDLHVPHFIVHDVLESIDERSFEAISNTIDSLLEKGLEIQYIGSILSEKIGGYSFITEEMLVEKVSEQDKYLRIN
ncbi:MAG: hypothetical protein RR557_08040 [Bacilli bacterium]